MHKHVPVEAFFALFRIFPANAGDNTVYNSIRILFFDDLQHPVRIGIKRPHLWSSKITRRNAVTVKHEVHSPIMRPTGIQIRSQGIQVISHRSRLRFR